MKINILSFKEFQELINQTYLINHKNIHKHEFNLRSKVNKLLCSFEIYIFIDEMHRRMLLNLF